MCVKCIVIAIEPHLETTCLPSMQTYTFWDLNVCILIVGHFEFMIVETVAGFKSGDSTFKIVIYVKREPNVKFGTFVLPVTVVQKVDAKQPD